MSARRTAMPVSLALALVFGGSACGKKDAPAAAAAELDEGQKTLYALGAAMGRNLQQLKLGDEQLDVVAAGLRDAAKGATLKADPAARNTEIQQLFQARQAEAAETEKGRGRDYADKAAAEAGAVRLDSGVVYRTLTAGTGPNPKATDVVRVHYKGSFVDGKVFDSSVERGQPAEFALNGVIPCWTEGVQRMKLKEKAQLVCPSDTAYGDSGRGPQMPGGATLVFEVELLEIKSARAGK